MDVAAMPLFQVMKAKMGYLSARQATLAQNVSNVDTPGYRARDISEPDFKKMAASFSSARSGNTGMMRTHPRHMIVAGMEVAHFSEVKRKQTDELNPNGNNVSIEEEMIRVADTQQEYQKVINLYGKTMDLIRTAIGRPGA